MPGRRPRSRLTGPSTRAQALEAGLNDRQLQHPAVARLSRDTCLPRALAAEPLGRLAAVLLTAPPGAVASHRSAAFLRGVEIPVQDPADRRVDVTVPLVSRAESRADRRVYRADLLPDEVTRRRTVPSTTAARTWRDLAGVLRPGPLLAVTDQLPRAGLHHRRAAGAARPPARRARIGTARTVLPLGDPRAESPMESVLRWLIHDAGFPPPVVQYEMRDTSGRFLGRGDLAWPEARVLVEFDGDVHRERRVFVQDLRRQNSLVVERWTVLRFSGADVYGRPAQVLSEIAQVVPRRDRRSRTLRGLEPCETADLAGAVGALEGQVRSGTVPRVVVDVVLKPEISDPQGQAVLGALGRLGHDGVTSVRQGKHFVLDVEGTPDEAEIRKIAETLLANPVIEDVELHLPTD
ncbi:phosphoribosylformylglycinamidine synthase subunit PurS [Geodermatophilus sp. SYSU D00815]